MVIVNGRVFLFFNDRWFGSQVIEVRISESAAKMDLVDVMEYRWPFRLWTHFSLAVGRRG